MRLRRAALALPALFFLAGAARGAPLSERQLRFAPRERIEGTDASEFLSGTSGNDEIVAKGGDDNVDARQGGDDDISLGPGQDFVRMGNGKVSAGSGHDNVKGFGDGELNAKGEGGQDILFGSQQPTAFNNLDGGTENDILIGGPREDNLLGGDGADRLYGKAASDTMRGGTGNDWMEGGEGDDNIRGEEGNDSLFGQEGKDTMEGGEGDDTLVGGPGGDHMDGGTGNDAMYSSGEGDNLIGGLGSDAFIIATDRVVDPDIIQDFDPTMDLIRLPTQLVPGIRFNTEGDPWVAWDQYFTITDVGDEKDRADLVAPGIVRERKTGWVFYFTDVTDLNSYLRIVRVLPTGTDITNKHFYILDAVPEFASTIPIWAM
ncbi:Serralysin-like metalloprotease [Hyaloraphidium curvatum]|nr:Serralysin-like metalloprotease [Hyaloraphidium curvatum]